MKNSLFKILQDFDDERITRDDFIEAIKKVKEHFDGKNNENKSELAKLAADLIKDIERLEKELSEKTDEGLSGMSKAQERALSEYKKSLDNVAQRLEKRIESIKDGLDGKDADENYILNTLLARLDRLVQEKIPEKKELTPEDLANMLETLKGKKRLSAEAIDGLEEKIRNLAPGKGLGGGTSAIGVAQSMKYIVKRETPSGTIDGANTAFTVKHTPYAVFSLVLNGEFVPLTGNYTIAGRTITFATAIPAAYSGKDFEIVYI